MVTDSITTGVLGTSAMRPRGVEADVDRQVEGERDRDGHAEHRIARDTGRSDWYAHYTLRVAKVERAYGWDRTKGG